MRFSGRLIVVIFSVVLLFSQGFADNHNTNQPSATQSQGKTKMTREMHQEKKKQARNNRRKAMKDMMASLTKEQKQAFRKRMKAARMKWNKLSVEDKTGFSLQSVLSLEKWVNLTPEQRAAKTKQLKQELFAANNTKK